MIFIAALLLQETLLTVGFGNGTSFTGTNIHSYVATQGTIYPTKIFGGFYRFSLSNPKFFVKAPFSIDKIEHLHIVGGSFRFKKNKIQPWIEPGIALYREKVAVYLFENEVYKEKQGRTAFALSAGVNLGVAGRLNFIPSIRVVGGRRPFWQADAGVGWKFGRVK